MDLILRANEVHIALDRTKEFNFQAPIQASRHLELKDTSTQENLGIFSLDQQPFINCECNSEHSIYFW